MFCREAETAAAVRSAQEQCENARNLREQLDGALQTIKDLRELVAVIQKAPASSAPGTPLRSTPGTESGSAYWYKW